MMDAVVVNLNPCIDMQLTTPEFRYGGLNRVQVAGRYAAGKGINVAMALKNLGASPICMGINYHENGEIITDALDNSGVSHDFVTVSGAVRTNIKLYDAATDTMTELNQPGAFVPDNTASRLCEKINNHRSAIPGYDEKCSSILVLSGSMPAGVPVDIYRQLCTNWPGRVILDAEGEALLLALKCDKPPFCIKPNLFELTSSFGVTLATKEEIAAFCRELIKTYGVRLICVSMGTDGALLVSEPTMFYSPALDLTVQGIQGAGDAMVAGLCYGLLHNAPEEELLKMAQAAAAASVVREGTLMCTQEGFLRYLEEVVCYFF